MSRTFICSKTEPIVEIKAGKLRGYKIDSTYTFQGIKYADAKRFQMPTEVQPWEGVKEATSYGYVSPLLKQEHPSGELLVPHRYWPMDENCQYLNIWTQSIDENAKKPVLVWLHGGGFSAGSSIEQVAYDGENMSKFGDVVVVSLNHRLNILGYLDLSPFGEKYNNSGNAGNADMVAALKWIQDNIENFGGDPSNITLFGQSGGGMKVWTLMQTPEADGLFHKGIIQSGLIDGFVATEKVDGTEIVKALLNELGYGEGEVEKLETIPYPLLAEAYNKVSEKLSKEGHYVGCTPIHNDFYVGDPRVVGFTDHAKTIPVMVGTVFAEFPAFGPGIADKEKLSSDQMEEFITIRYGENSEKLISLFKEAYPEKNLTDLLFIDSLFRAPSIDFIAKKAEHQEAPTYSYMFSLEFPYDGGRTAWHCSEIPFVFRNTDKVPVCNIHGVSDLLEKQMFDAWVSFAKNGTPTSNDLPEWPACKPGDEATMIFDRACEVKHNYDHELIALHSSIEPSFESIVKNEDIQH
ncbi:carboxylesterase/lipase family protein [Lederbergia wuyishanensis]|uniref:Carboxylic ester hydrolase n=1 Tax=Lederbergia wuyishanensis TaxID=1347903 RepID=A0ABU0D6Z4_9BACI|nr:carboxylesterase family protein [Lederbergia wuyishanensis]MCJ8008867.1 carboxylesterase family protein [Lederbergia wuyishanensis]MDQ0344189.1 para-nitrobenzyl esterase [Lederbergia wuyishanensis]